MPTKRTPQKRNAKLENTTARSGVSQKRVLKHTQPSVKEKQKASLPKPIMYFIGVLIVALLVGLLYLSWNQWLRYDDQADFQGEWISQETGQIVTITDSQIIFNKNTSYSYTLDTFDKTITFSFQDLSGKGTYAFSEERDTIKIVERGDASGTSVTTLVKSSAVVDTPSVEQGDPQDDSESNQEESQDSDSSEEGSEDYENEE